MAGASLPRHASDRPGTQAGHKRDTGATEAGQQKGSKSSDTPLHQWCGPTTSRIGFLGLMKIFPPDPVSASTLTTIS